MLLLSIKQSYKTNEFKAQDLIKLIPLWNGAECIWLDRDSQSRKRDYL